MDFPRTIQKVVLQQPKEFNKITFTIPEEKVKEIIKDFMIGKFIGPEMMRLPEKFEIDIGIENPYCVTISFLDA